MRTREWYRCKDPVAMVRSVSYPLAALPPAEQALYLRRHRLFTLTAARPVLDRIDRADCYSAAEVALRLAEGTATESETVAADALLRAAWQESMDAASHYFEAPAEVWAIPRLINVLALLLKQPDGASYNLVVPQSIVHPGDPIPLLTPEETSQSCHLLREVFGDRRWGIESSWRTSTAVAIAKDMYDSRDFAAMPLLADALEDAGCADERILDHCRGPGPHVKGCWVVDLVLGKE